MTRSRRNPRRPTLAELLATPARDRRSFPKASTAAIAEADAVGPKAAAAAVAAVLEPYQEGAGSTCALRAVDLARTLRLAGAIPALVSCVERLDGFDPVANLALLALRDLGPEAAPALVKALGRCRSEEIRTLIEVALAEMLDDGELAELIQRSIEQLRGVPEAGAPPPSELPALLARFDRLELPPPGPGEHSALAELVATGDALRALSGELSPERQAKLDRAAARSEELILGDLAPSTGRNLH